ncbi:MAG TPA: phosphoglycerate dehydrogenase [Elusimicrobiota bacterium]|nr:phosphoglycerate dehydrogenase [Elusimicrobiota bacterium]
MDKSHPIRILVSDPLAEEGISFLKGCEGVQVEVSTGLSSKDLIAKLAGCQALLVRSETKVTEEVIAAARDLKVIGRAGVGVDNINVQAATKAGIIVMNVPGGNTISAAEHTIGLLMSLARNIPQADASIRREKWERSKFIGTEITGKTLGVVGLGRIGREVAVRAIGLGMRVLGYDPVWDEGWCRRAGVACVAIDDILKQSDFITIHVPMSDKTRGLLNREALAKTKPGVRLINCARGGLIEEKVLLEFIESGHVKGAALDVFEKEPPWGSPVLNRPEVIMTPHLGASTEEAQIKVSEELAKNVVEYFEKGIARFALNLPAIDVAGQSHLLSYVTLAERLGRFASQIVSAPIQGVKLNYVGELGRGNPALFTSSALAGLLKKVESRISPVNAQAVATAQGLSVEQQSYPDSKDYASVLEIEVATSKEVHRLAGTVYGQKDFRLVRVDDMTIDVVLAGNLLVMQNTDKPGVVGHTGTVLGAAAINIAGMDVGRNRPGGVAVSIWNVDGQVSEDVLKKVRSHPAILNVQMVTL